MIEKNGRNSPRKYVIKPKLTFDNRKKTKTAKEEEESKETVPMNGSMHELNKISMFINSVAKLIF